MRYYLQQAGRGKNNGMRPVYAAPIVHQLGYGIGSFFERSIARCQTHSLERTKVLGRQTLRTEGDILKDAARSSPDQNPRDIVSKHVMASTQNLYAKLRGRGRKRKRSGKIVKHRATKKHTTYK